MSKVYRFTDLEMGLSCSDERLQVIILAPVRRFPHASQVMVNGVVYAVVHISLDVLNTMTHGLALDSHEPWEYEEMIE
jgi:hypothetical protein